MGNQSFTTGLNFNFEDDIVQLTAKAFGNKTMEPNNLLTENLESSPGPTEKLSGLSALRLFVFDFVKVFVIAVAIIVPIRWFLFQPFVVTGDSMLPNYEDGNYLIIDEITYRFREPQRGEVVVMRFPNDRSQFFIKRLVGLPNERIVIENGRVVIFTGQEPKGQVLAEGYLPLDNTTFGNIDRKLGPQEYFVLGDNRLSSSDSRIWGSLPRQNIVGRVYVRVFPLKEFGIFNLPDLGFSSP